MLAKERRSDSHSHTKTQKKKKSRPLLRVYQYDKEHEISNMGLKLQLEQVNFQSLCDYTKTAVTHL